jgi:hypothetical protein
VGARRSPDDTQGDASDEVVVDDGHRALAAREQPARTLAACQQAEQHVRGRDERDDAAHCPQYPSAVFALETGDAYRLPRYSQLASAR